MELYEPEKAQEHCKVHYGKTKSLYEPIMYPSVNTCLTLTYICPEGLVGAHFGLTQKNGTIYPFNKIEDTLNEMDALMVKAGGKPNKVFLIGNILIWSHNASKNFTELKSKGYKVLFDPITFEGDHTNFVQEETGLGEKEAATVDIEIWPQGFVRISQHGNKKKKMLTFPTITTPFTTPFNSITNEML